MFITNVIKSRITTLNIIRVVISVVCDMTPCSVIEVCRRFGGIFCLNIQDKVPYVM
jgi:hypothetical protein